MVKLTSKQFSKLTEYGCDVWAVMEWECCVKSPEQGAREGAKFIENHIIEATRKYLMILQEVIQIKNRLIKY